MPADDLIEAIVKGYAEAKLQKLHILNQGGANLVYNHGANTANLLKLSEDQKLNITPFPSPAKTEINMDSSSEELVTRLERLMAQEKEDVPEFSPAPNKAGGMSRLGATALGALGGAGGLGAAIMLAQSFMSPSETIPEPPPPDNQVQAKDVGLDVEGFEWR